MITMLASFAALASMLAITVGGVMYLYSAIDEYKENDNGSK